MQANGASGDKLGFERSARRDIRTWLVGLVGLVFAVAGAMIDPAQNCSDDGQCAPWLVPVAQGLGLLALGGALIHLWQNPRRGCRYDAAGNYLEWWQQRRGASDGRGGRIALTDIGVIRLVNDGDDSSGIELLDRAGQRQPAFDGEVVPWPHAVWATRLQELAPHIRIERT